jgi:hypothetical protein
MNPFYLIKQWWMEKRRQEAEINKMIDDHQRITSEAEQALDKMIAALDGETGWFTCSCKDNRDHPQRRSTDNVSR